MCILCETLNSELPLSSVLGFVLFTKQEHITNWLFNRRQSTGLLATSSSGSGPDFIEVK